MQHKRFSNLFYYDSCICAENIGKEKSFLFFVGRYLAHDCIRSRMKLNRLFCLRLVRVVFSFRLADFFSVAVCRSNISGRAMKFFLRFFATSECMWLQRYCEHLLLHASRTNSIIKKYKFLFAMWTASMNEQTTS